MAQGMGFGVPMRPGGPGLLPGGAMLQMPQGQGPGMMGGGLLQRGPGMRPGPGGPVQRPRGPKMRPHPYRRNNMGG
eukprot:536312-Amorphochlora_amoeboformis.AAC.1